MSRPTGNVRALEVKREFVASLHGLRGLAALSVLLFHWQQFFPAAAQWLKTHAIADTILDPSIYLEFGWLGVPLFFVLSGYLLGQQVIGAHINAAFLGRFWARRALRIYPAVWAELLVLLLIAVWLPGFVSKEGMDTLPLQFLLWINLPPAMATPINLVWWTLPVELCFYLVLPLLGYALRLVGGWGLILMGLAVTLVWRAWVFSTPDVSNYLTVLPVLDSLPGVFFTFMLGVCLNFLPTDIGDSARRAAMVTAICALLLLMQWQMALNDVYWHGHWILVIWPPMVACTIATVVYCLSKPSIGRHWLGNPLLIGLGHVSFGIYLWHFQVLRLQVELFPDAWSTPLTSVMGLLVVVILTLIMAALSYYLIERPCMRWGARRFSRV